MKHLRLVLILSSPLLANAAERENALKLPQTLITGNRQVEARSDSSSANSVFTREDIDRLRECAKLLCEVNLGGTAIGTGINTPEHYSGKAIAYLADISGVALVPAGDLIEATSDMGAFVTFSGVLKRIAVKLSKMCNDLRLLGSGPRAGFGEIRLPAVQAGSSIMPSKVNPVMPEVINQIAYQVIGNDLTVTMGAEAGQLQLNAFEPIIGWSLFKSINHLANACQTLQRNCIEGIQANHEVLAERVRNSVTLVTALNPLIGYEKAALLGKTALATGLSIAACAEQLGIMKASDVEALLKPALLTQPRSAV